MTEILAKSNIFILCDTNLCIFFLKMILEELSKRPFLLLLLLFGMVTLTLESIAYEGRCGNWSNWTLGIVSLIFSYLLYYSRRHSIGIIGGICIASLLINVTHRTDQHWQIRQSEGTKTREQVLIVKEHFSNEPYSKIIASDEDKRLILLTSFEKLPKLYHGDTLIALIRNTPIQRASIYDPYNEAKYLHTMHIFQKGMVDSLIQINKNNGSHPKRLSQMANEWACLQIEKYTKREYSALLSGILFGNKQGISKDTKNAFIQTGTAHILAVSGLHVGMLYVIVSFIFRFIPLPKKFKWIKSVLTILSIWCFAFICGGGASIIRAVVMFTLWEIGIHLKKYADSINILCATAFIMVVLDPCTLFDIGFQLSVAAVLSIILFQSHFRKIWPGSNKITNHIAENLWITISVQILIIPLTLYYFHQFPTYFIPANIIWIPLSFLLMVCGLMIIVTAGLIPTIAIIFGWLCNVLMLTGTKTFEVLEKLPFYIIDGIWINLFQLIITFSSIYFLYQSFSRKHFPSLRISMLLMIVYGASFLVQYSLANRTEEIIFYSLKDKEAFDKRVEHRVISGLTDSIPANVKLYRAANFVDQVWELRDSLSKVRYLEQLASLGILLVNKDNFKNIQKYDTIPPNIVVLGNTLKPFQKKLIKKIFTNQDAIIHDLKTEGSLVLKL